MHNIQYGTNYQAGTHYGGCEHGGEPLGGGQTIALQPGKQKVMGEVQSIRTLPNILSFSHMKLLWGEGGDIKMTEQRTILMHNYIKSNSKTPP